MGCTKIGGFKNGKLEKNDMETLRSSVGYIGVFGYDMIDIYAEMSRLDIAQWLVGSSTCYFPSADC